MNLLSLIITCLIITLSSSVSASTMDEALELAAQKLKITGALNSKRDVISVEIVNFHSQQKDKTAKKIESLLYFALEDQGFRTVLLSETLAGSGNKTVYLKGTYEGQGDFVSVRLQLIKGLVTGEVLTQVSVEYEEKRQRSNTLVAVLDIESDDLPNSMKKAFSDLFRSALGDLGGFDLASSADVDKMNPDAIQSSTGCTRDECATIIGEQLGVDRVISTSLFKLTENKFMLTGKMMDILDGSILKTSTVRYKGKLEDMDSALNELAAKITGKKFQNLGFAQQNMVGRPKSKTILTLNIEPADAKLFIDGVEYGTPYDSNPDVLWESRKEIITLPEGNHRFMLSHPYGVKQVKKTLILKLEKQNLSLKLEIEPDYLLAQKEVIDVRDAAEEEYQNALSSRNTKLIVSLLATLTTGAYSYSEYTSAQDELKLMEENQAIINSTNNYSVANEYYTKTQKNQEAINGHNENMQLGMALSTLLGLYSFWVWADEPDKPETISWLPIIKPDGFQFALSARW